MAENVPQLVDLKAVINEYREAKKQYMMVVAEIDELVGERQKLHEHYSALGMLINVRLGDDAGGKKRLEIDDSLKAELASEGIKPRKTADAIWKAVEESGKQGATLDEIKDRLQKKWGINVEGNNTIYTTLSRFSTKGSKGRKLRKEGDRYYV